MKLVITGASGFLAGELIPLLRDRGFELVLVSARAEVLVNAYPDLTCASYDDLDTHLQGADCVLHLAVKNNDSAGELADFRAINVDQTLSVLHAAKAAGVGKFIYTSSFHTLSLGGPTSHYARSKAEAEAHLAVEHGIDVSVVHMAAVYGRQFNGKLSILNRLATPLQRLAMTCLGALRPTVHVDRVADRIADITNGKCSAPHYLYEPAQENSVYTWAKRAVDLSFVLFVAVVLGWLLAIVWVVIRMDSHGPGLFVQERVGKDGKIFHCYKFRTMQQGTVQAGTHEVTAASITRIGHFLRKTKLDELPQIVNILRNELSLIGPRPCLPSQVELVEKRRALGVFDVKPGISGLAQIQNIDMSEPERLSREDALYVALQSLPLDLKITLATATGSGQGDKVSSD